MVLLLITAAFTTLPSPATCQSHTITCPIRQFNGITAMTRSSAPISMGSEGVLPLSRQSVALYSSPGDRTVDLDGW